MLERHHRVGTRYFTKLYDELRGQLRRLDIG